MLKLPRPDKKHWHTYSIYFIIWILFYVCICFIALVLCYFVKCYYFCGAAAPTKFPRWKQHFISPFIKYISWSCQDCFRVSVNYKNMTKAGEKGKVEQMDHCCVKLWPGGFDQTQTFHFQFHSWFKGGLQKQPSNNTVTTRPEDFIWTNWLMLCLKSAGGYIWP